ncbi:hypothetical protein ACHAQC_010770 [Fusarium culmorum]
MPRRRQKHSPPAASSSRDEVHPRLAPYEPDDGSTLKYKDGIQLEAHEIVHYLRGEIESYHRQMLHMLPFQHPLWMADIPLLQGYQAICFFNKSVPIYLLRGDKKKQGLSHTVSFPLHNFLYKKWFRPYRSDIERGQFIAHVIDVCNQPESSNEATAVDVAMALRSAIHTRLLRLPPKQFYTITALFEALVVVIPAESYHRCNLISNVFTMTVLVLLTGEVNGLSGPISFDSIETEVERVTISGLSGVRTKLEVAVDFIMCLEKRETAAFGPQPDLVASTTNEPHPEEYYGSLYEAETYSAREMGWRYGPIVGPSSKWVSMKSYPEWTGTSAREDMVYTKQKTKWWRFHERSCTCCSTQQTEQTEEISFCPETER